MNIINNNQVKLIIKIENFIEYNYCYCCYYYQKEGIADIVDVEDNNKLAVVDNNNPWLVRQQDNTPKAGQSQQHPDS